MDAWGPAIQEAVTKTQLPDSLARFREGETLRFGDLAISWDCLAAKNKVLRWQQIKAAYVGNGQLYVREHGRRSSKVLAQINQIPNYYVFSTLPELRLNSEA